MVCYSFIETSIFYKHISIDIFYLTDKDVVVLYFKIYITEMQKILINNIIFLYIVTFVPKSNNFRIENGFETDINISLVHI